MRKEDQKTDRQNRMDSLLLQISKLYYRFKLVRNAALSYSVAVVWFMIASIFIGLKYLFQWEKAGTTALIFFLLGILAVLSGILFAAIELWKGHKIVNIEVHEPD